MKTRMPISTISFNTENFLKEKLDDLVKAKRLEFYFYVKHKGEDDEGGLKDHIHVFIVPNGPIDTGKLYDEFIEKNVLDLTAKPLKCLPFKSSKTEDAILYFIHEPSYLAYKGQTRKYHYNLSDVVTSDTDEFQFYYRSIDMVKITPYRKMADAQEIGMSFAEYLKKGFIPVQQVHSYKMAWYLLEGEKIARERAKTRNIIENDFVESVQLGTGEVKLKK